MSEKQTKYSDLALRQHNVSEIIRALMAERKIDDMSLAKATGIASSSLSRMKNDPSSNPTLASLQPLADYFGITISQLIGETALNKSYIAEPKRQHKLTIQQIPIIAWDEVADFLAGRIEEFSYWIPSNQLLGEKVFSLVVPSPNWGSLFIQGAHLLLEVVSEINDGDYALVFSQTESKYFIKQVIIEGTDTYLKSVNPDIKVTEKLKQAELVQAKVVEVRVCFNSK